MPKAAARGSSKIVNDLKRGESYQAAVGKAAGVPFARFQIDWKTYLAHREYPKETLALSVDKLEFKED